MRYFERTAELVAAFPGLGALDCFIHLMIHAERAGGAIVERRITYKPGAVKGATHRFDAGGWGLIQLYFGTMRKGRLTPSHTNHNTESRALAWSDTEHDLGPVSAWDFAEVTRASARLNRFIRKIAPRKLGSRPVLRAAAAALDSGGLELALNG